MGKKSVKPSQTCHQDVDAIDANDEPKSNMVKCLDVF